MPHALSHNTSLAGVHCVPTSTPYPLVGSIGGGSAGSGNSDQKTGWRKWPKAAKTCKIDGNQVQILATEPHPLPQDRSFRVSMGLPEEGVRTDGDGELGQEAGGFRLLVCTPPSDLQGPGPCSFASWVCPWSVRASPQPATPKPLYLLERPRHCWGCVARAPMGCVARAWVGGVARAPMGCVVRARLGGVARAWVGVSPGPGWGCRQGPGGGCEQQAG